MVTGPLNDSDLIELSDFAWGLVDPEGEHEAEEQAWVALLPMGWPAVATVEELSARLGEVVRALVPPSPAVPLRVVATVMAFAATHPDRRDEAVLPDALGEAFPGGVLPDEVAAWLADRRGRPPARRRSHGASHPRRHFHTKPPGRGEGR